MPARNHSQHRETPETDTFSPPIAVSQGDDKRPPFPKSTNRRGWGPGAGPIPEEQRDEENRIKQKAKDTFAVFDFQRPCQSMQISVRAGHSDAESAETNRQKFMESSSAHGECVKTFDLQY